MMRLRHVVVATFATVCLLCFTGCAQAADTADSPSHADKPLRICMLSGSLEYKSDRTLGWYKSYLEKHYPVKITMLKRVAKDKMPGLEALEDCDVVIVFVRRMTIDGKDLELIRKRLTSGVPIVGIRTASHAFQNWLEFDRIVLGGNYKNHYGHKDKTKVSIVPEAKDHPILTGFKPFITPGTLYRNTGLKKDTTVLLRGSIPEHTEPIAWTRVHKGGRVFYTSLGHVEDFKNVSFVRLITNGLYWVVKRDPPKFVPGTMP